MYILRLGFTGIQKCLALRYYCGLEKCSLDKNSLDREQCLLTLQMLTDKRQTN